MLPADVVDTKASGHAARNEAKSSEVDLVDGLSQLEPPASSATTRVADNSPRNLPQGSSKRDDGVDLLHVLDSMVKRQTAPAGIAGDLCVGVRHDGTDTWWHVQFSPDVKTALLQARPDDTDAWVLLSNVQANAILNNGDIPDGRAPDVHGDLRLFQRFTTRYLVKQGAHDVRSARL